MAKSLSLHSTFLARTHPPHVHSTLLFDSALLYSTPLHFTSLHSTPVHSTPSTPLRYLLVLAILQRTQPPHLLQIRRHRLAVHRVALLGGFVLFLSILRNSNAVWLCSVGNSFPLSVFAKQEGGVVMQFGEFAPSQHHAVWGICSLSAFCETVWSRSLGIRSLSAFCETARRAHVVWEFAPSQHFAKQQGVVTQFGEFAPSQHFAKQYRGVDMPFRSWRSNRKRFDVMQPLNRFLP
jgi:hypothetical protein